MSKQRTSIPRDVRDSVSKEFSHRCAICGADGPQLHHLDENPANNDPLNLIPLCPNCHLTDHHNPTRKHDPKKLRLFRIHKDPTILTPQFEALFERMAFLDSVGTTVELEKMERAAGELIGFVGQLEMGGFYARKLGGLLNRPSWASVTILGDPESERRSAESWTRLETEYQHQLMNNRLEVERLVVELLRFQNWRKN